MSEHTPRDDKSTGAGATQPGATVGDQGSTGQSGPSGATRADEAQPSRDFWVASDTGETATSRVDTEVTDHGSDTGPGNLKRAIPGYEILGELGRGSMGVVYHARQVRLNRHCALKKILGGAHADAVASIRFQAEAQAVARLQHPNVVQIHSIGEAD